MIWRGPLLGLLGGAYTERPQKAKKRDERAKETLEKLKELSEAACDVLAHGLRIA
jgi:hypothetical protein